MSPAARSSARSAAFASRISARPLIEQPRGRLERRVLASVGALASVRAARFAAAQALGDVVVVRPSRTRVAGGAAPALAARNEAVPMDDLVGRVRESSRTASLFMPGDRCELARGVLGDSLAEPAAPLMTSTASPGSKLPSTPTIPTGSRLEPLSRSTRAAPASTRTPPRVGFAYLSHSLKLEASRRAVKLAPISSPAAAPRSVPRPGAVEITAGIPDSLAIPAAAILLCIPPHPKAEADADLDLRRAERSRSARSARPQGRAAGRREEPVDVRQQHQ